MSKKELLTIAAVKYASAHFRSVVFLREDSPSYHQAKGYLDGICTAYELDYEIEKSPRESDIETITFSHQRSGRKFLEVKIE